MQIITYCQGCTKDAVRGNWLKPLTCRAHVILSVELTSGTVEVVAMSINYTAVGETRPAEFVMAPARKSRIGNTYYYTVHGLLKYDRPSAPPSAILSKTVPKATMIENARL